MTETECIGVEKLEVEKIGAEVKIEPAVVDSCNLVVERTVAVEVGTLVEVVFEDGAEVEELRR